MKRQSQDGDSQSEELYFEPDVIPLVPEFIQKKEEKLTGALRGTAYHRVLECLDYRRADSARQIREQMESWVEEQKLSPLQRDCVRAEEIASFARSGLGERMALADREGRLTGSSLL